MTFRASGGLLTLAVVLLPLTLLSAGCASSQPKAQQPFAKEAQTPCPFGYVYAPGNYIIDIASGAEVILDPLARDFALFCSPGEARAALNEEIRNGREEGGDWRIYRVGGSFEDLAQNTGQGQFQLKRMAPIVDWALEEV